ncbi:fructose 1,6-bisphosphatase [Candidatus Gottesmanbacteria bacterium RIFCSPLOWO2_01_FULL_49_10]|uniref:Fructose-1,6-bisphosphate aldolase/phosphatase n=1 Tax=Candidatus Gottesmanbacteria bacterium RIFCSPLOWO2_01_FULL_49_10 TaxID=1798396 RepID=A0A1F6B075_9BACT|nr:MAG: fructose 1,6-bisphosphatase [Candidatus Gottesmanbacteria bacterium RIFCSPLOWO2_01_FULL_49_10]
MKTTLSIIKADTGSIGGHNRPSDVMLAKAKEAMGVAVKSGLLTDARVTFTGDDIALLMIHDKGTDNPDIHKLAWDTFVATTAIAKSQGLYGAGQDLLKDAFSGNVRGMGPGSAEIELEERPAEPFVVFAADKCGPGVFNYPFFCSFADPFHNAGLLLAPEMRGGFTFNIMDVNYTEGDRVISLKVPCDYYDVATLLRDPNHYVIESIVENAGGLTAAVASTSRLHNIAGKYVGKDDPVAIVRTQKSFPDTGEITSPWSLAHYVLGNNRGSHHVAVMPVKQNTIISYFDGPTIVTAAGYCVHEGKLTEAVDIFDQPFWDMIREKASQKTLEMRRQGFFNPAMGPQDEMEYTGVMENLKRLDEKFVVRKK